MKYLDATEITKIIDDLIKINDNEIDNTIMNEDGCFSLDAEMNKIKCLAEERIIYRKVKNVLLLII